MSFDNVHNALHSTQPPNHTVLEKQYIGNETAKNYMYGRRYVQYEATVCTCVNITATIAKTLTA